MDRADAATNVKMHVILISVIKRNIFFFGK